MSMKRSVIAGNPTALVLRQFTGIVLVLLVVGTEWLHCERTLQALLLLCGAGLNLVAWIRAPWIRPLFRGLTILTFPLNWLTSHLVLAVLFYGVFTPFGLWFRVIGRDPLRRNFDRTARSYWNVRAESRDVQRYFHQY